MFNYDIHGVREIDGEVAFAGLPRAVEKNVEQIPYAKLQQELNTARELKIPESFQDAMRRLLIEIKREATNNPGSADKELINTLFDWSNSLPYPDENLLGRLINPDNSEFRSNIRDGSERGGRLVLGLGPDSGDGSFAEGIIGKLNTWVQARAGDHLRVGSVPGLVERGQSFRQAVTTIRSLTGK